ncbi:hypothetical protein [Bradyrhizobium sp. USDA 3364]
MRTIEWCASDREYLSDPSFRQREDHGQIETLRHLNVPNWLIRLMLWVIWRRRLRSFAANNNGEAERVAAKQPDEQLS